MHHRQTGNKFFISLILLLILLSYPLQVNGEPEKISLELAKKRALANSRELQMLAFQLQGARNNYNLDIRHFFPRLQLGMAGNDSVLLESPDNSSRRISLTLTQPLYDGGRGAIRRDLARTALYLENHTYTEKQEAILDGVFNLYYRLLVLEEQKKLQEEIYVIARDQLKITEKEMAIGQIREIDLVETELQVRSLELQLASSITGLEELYFEFNRATGQNIKAPVQLEGHIEYTYSGLNLDKDPEYYFRVAKANNIQFRHNRFEIKQSREEMRMAAQNYLPDISAETTFSLSGNNFPLQEGGVTFKLNLSLPTALFPLSASFTAGKKEKEYSRGTTSNIGILEDFSYPLSLKQARVNLQMMEFKQQEMEETFRFQIEKFLAQYVQKKQNLSLAGELLGLQKKKLNIMDKQLIVGEITRLEWLKSRSSFFQAEIELFQQVLELINFERSFESLLGIEAGTLEEFAKGGPDEKMSS